MTVEGLIHNLESLGASLAVEGDQLVIEAPQGVLGREEIERLRDDKPQVGASIWPVLCWLWWRGGGCGSVARIAQALCSSVRGRQFHGCGQSSSVQLCCSQAPNTSLPVNVIAFQWGM